jgi:putative copper export protein
VLDPSLHGLLLSSDFGTTTAIRAFGLIFIAGSTRWAGRLGMAISVIGATLVAISFALMGHTASDPQRWLLAPLLLIHLLAIAFWLGALWPLLIVIRLETSAIAASVINQFSRTAMCLVPLVLLAGLAMGGLLLTSLSGLRTPYGILLVTKFAGFSVLMALAALNKWRLTPGVAHNNQVSMLALRVSVLAEGALIFAVITVTTVMSSLFSPRH